MDIDELRRLLVLAEYERITDAAEALQMSQPTLSRLLARAERELGTRLFERDAAGARPNPHGEVVLAAARDITRRYDQLRDDLATLLDPETGTVRLAFMDSMATSLVPRILSDFRREAPHVRVALQQKPGHQMIPDLASGLTELAIIAPRPARTAGCRCSGSVSSSSSRPGIGSPAAARRGWTNWPTRTSSPSRPGSGSAR